MTRMSNQEKSARRYEALSKIAEQTAEENKEFSEFLAEREAEPTWRRLETWLKRKAETGATVKIVIVSAGD